MTYAAPIEIAQAALARVGGQMITSLEDGSMPATVFNTNYAGIVAKRLSMHRWSFASMPVALVYQGERAVGQYRHAYVAPPETIRVHWVGSNIRRLIDWHMDDGKILTPFRGDWQALISRRVPESEWAPDFADAMVKEVEALFQASLVRQPEAARLLSRDAEELFRMAMVSDRRQVPGARAIRPGPLVMAQVGLNPRAGYE